MKINGRDFQKKHLALTALIFILCSAALFAVVSNVNYGKQHISPKPLQSSSEAMPPRVATANSIPAQKVLSPLPNGSMYELLVEKYGEKDAAILDYVDRSKSWPNIKAVIEPANHDGRFDHILIGLGLFRGRLTAKEILDIHQRGVEDLSPLLTTIAVTTLPFDEIMMLKEKGVPIDLFSEVLGTTVVEDLVLNISVRNYGVEYTASEAVEKLTKLYEHGVALRSDHSDSSPVEDIVRNLRSRRAEPELALAMLNFFVERGLDVDSNISSSISGIQDKKLREKVMSTLRL